VVVANACNGCYCGLANVCRINSSTKPALKHCHIDLLVSELKKSNHRHNFKESHLKVMGFYFFEDLLAVVNDLLLCNHLVVNGDALTKRTYVWGNEHSGFQVHLLQCGCSFDSHSSLAIGTCNVNAGN
jgi:hypothetical protein